MKIYISGPITGIKDRNKYVFQDKQSEIAAIFNTLKKEKVKIINPVKLGFKLDKEFNKLGKIPAWEDYMKICIKELCDSTLIYLLPGWGLSNGAIFEKHIANKLKIPCAETREELIKIITE
jgi:hypothetical protein